MEITFRGETTDHTVLIRVTRTKGDGVCQHCGKTRIVRLASIHIPLSMWQDNSLLRETQNELWTLAVLNGQEYYTINVGLICLGKYFEQYGQCFSRKWGESLTQALTRAAAAVERYSTKLEKLQNLQKNCPAFAEKLWGVYYPTELAVQEIRNNRYALEREHVNPYAEIHRLRSESEKSLPPETKIFGKTDLRNFRWWAIRFVQKGGDAADMYNKYEDVVRRLIDGCISTTMRALRANAELSFCV